MRNVLTRTVFAVTAFLATLLSLSLIAYADEPGSLFANFDAIATRLNFGANKSTRADLKSVRTIKVAVLDNGFKGYKDAVGKTLPATTIFHAGPVAVDEATEEAHGLVMAQLMSGLLARVPGVSYELHLFSAFGYSNLESAVNAVTEQKFDVVLYAQVWEYGGNGDGRGFINSLINKATSAGVVWVNASGNFGDSTYRTTLQKADDEWAKLPGPNNSVRVRCVKNEKGKCPIRVVLSWNDFKDDVKEGTDKDLDLVLTDDALKIVQSSGLAQKKTFPDGEPGSSLYPREIIQAEVDPGVYYIRVKYRSDNFTDRDQIRIVTSGEFLQYVDHSDGETLLSPADNQTVITVGATDSEKSGYSRSMSKPELTTPSLVELAGKQKEQYKGSSNSSAMAAAAVVVVKGVHPEYNRTQIINLLAQGGGTTTPQLPPQEPSRSVGGDGQTPQRDSPVGAGLSLEVLQFESTEPHCFRIIQLGTVPSVIQPMLRTGARPVLTTAGTKLFVGIDPFANIPGLVRQEDDDMVVATLQGFVVMPRSEQMRLPPAAIEVVQMPQGAVLCGMEQPIPSRPRAPRPTGGGSSPGTSGGSSSRAGGGNGNIRLPAGSF
jgi:hypothetical protein